MKAIVTTLTMLCVLIFCAVASGQSDIIVSTASPPVPGILSAIPADAYGFAATNSLQGSYDNLMIFVQALGLSAPTKSKLSVIQDKLDQIDLNGPAAVVLLDPQKFPGEPVALLFSSSTDPVAAVKSNSTETAEELPPGVFAGSDGFFAVKKGFVVFAPGADQAAAMLADESSFEVMPAVKDALDKGQIVLAGDLQRAGPWLNQMMEVAHVQMTAQMSKGPAAQMPQTAMAMDMFSIYFDFAGSLLGQTDKLAVVLDVNDQKAVLTKWVSFKADSSAAAIINAQAGQDVPSYSALPGGAFLMAGAANMDPEQLGDLTEVVMTKLFELPSFKDKFSAEHATQMISDSKASIALFSGMALTVNLGNPMTGMINAVGRYDVSDSATYKELMAKMHQSDYMSAYTQAFAFGGSAMEFIYTPAVETYAAVDIDTIKMQMTPPEPLAEDDLMAQQKQMIMAQQMQMMTMMYGPDMTFRMAAPSDKQILFTMGGGYEQMERAINVAQGNGSVLADQPKIALAQANLPANRFAEAHLDLGQFMPMVNMIMMAVMGGAAPAGPSQPADAPLISFSASAEADTFRSDLVVPTESVRTLIASFAGMKGGMAPAGPPSEDFEETD